MASTENSTDLFSTPQHIYSNFHCRVGKPPQSSIPTGLPVREYKEAPGEREEKHRGVDLERKEREEVELPPPASQYGYPHPGEQSPKAAAVMTSNYFVT